MTYGNTDPGPNPTERVITFVANDGVGSGPAATTTITMTTVNNAPTAVDDSHSVNEGGTLNVAAPGVVGNDTDPDLDTLNAVLVSGPTHASSFTLNPNGSFDYVHDGNGFATDTLHLPRQRRAGGLGEHRDRDDHRELGERCAELHQRRRRHGARGQRRCTATGWATAISTGGAEEADRR